MANYDSIASIAVIYEGTVSSFNSITDKSAYYGSVVFITGSTASNATVEEKQQAIWVSQDNGSNAHFLNMSDTDTIAKALSYVKGVIVDGQEYDVTAGGAYLTLVGDTGIKIEVNSGAINFNTQALRTVVGQAQTTAQTALTTAQNAVNVVSGLRGEDTTGTVRDIAEEVVGTVEENLLGPEGANASSVTIRGNRKAVNDIKTALFGVANPESMDKIQTSVLPDVIMGQLKFGGTIGNTETSVLGQKLKVSPTSSYIDEFRSEGITGPFEITAKFNSSGFDPSKNEGWYFIVKKPNAVGMGGFGWNAVTGASGTLYEDFYEVGDWFLSTGEDWEKIDNTDTVVGVAGMQGDITTKSLVGKLSTKNDENDDPLVKESGIKINGVAVADNSKEYISVTTPVGTKQATISVETASMQDVIGELIQGNDALATANDVFNFIKARLSIKVVSSN